jgi:hypothetical protein
VPASGVKHVGDDEEGLLVCGPPSLQSFSHGVPHSRVLDQADMLGQVTQQDKHKVQRGSFRLDCLRCHLGTQGNFLSTIPPAEDAFQPKQEMKLYEKNIQRYGVCGPL